MRRFWRWLDTGLPDLILLGILRLTIRLAHEYARLAMTKEQKK